MWYRAPLKASQYKSSFPVVVYQKTCFETFFTFYKKQLQQCPSSANLQALVQIFFAKSVFVNKITTTTCRDPAVGCVL